MSFYDDLFKPLLPKIELSDTDRINPYLHMARWGMPVIQSPSVICSVSLADSIPIHTSPYLTERKQVIFPKGGRKRIQKKCRNNPANWAEVPSEKVIVVGREYYMHPATLEKMKTQLRRIEQEARR